MKVKRINSMGMELDECSLKSCIAQIGIGNNWATIYMISSDKEGKGHATELLKQMKIYYEKQGKKFGSSVALNSHMKHLLQKLNITEYK